MRTGWPAVCKQNRRSRRLLATPYGLAQRGLGVGHRLFAVVVSWWGLEPKVDCVHRDGGPNLTAEGCHQV